MENRHVWTKEFTAEVTEMIRQGAELEIAYSHDTMPRGVLGLTAPMMSEYLQFIANRRLNQLGLETIYTNPSNPFPWMSEVADLRKEKNFFESRVTDYQTSQGLDW